jgi:nucleotide-binding universal stress UspA family protein
MTLPANILVPIDFSPYSEHVVDYALELADRLDAKIHLVNVIGVPALGAPELGLAIASAALDSVVDENQRALDKLVAAHRDSGRMAGALLRTGDARDVILQTATEVEADLIVMATHGRRGLSRALLGSVAESVVRTSPIPVLTLHAPT